jgi:penicillin amidase
MRFGAPISIPFRTLWVLWLAAISSLAAGQAQSLPGLSAPVEVIRDPHGVPHIYAQTWTDASRVLGYLHATDRLWQMDLLRRRASGTTAEILGPGGLESDIMMRTLRIRRSCEELWNSQDLPADFRAELEAYAAGVNARILELGDTLPAPFQMLGYQPADWTPVDTLAFSKYMGWDQSGTDDDLWFGMLVEKLGPTAVEELWPLERPYEIPTVSVQAPRDAPSAVSDLTPIPGASAAYLAAFERIERGGWFLRGGSFGSNNWAIDGSKTASGKPMVANDPHLGFMLPSLWYTAHLSVQGRNVAGATFPVGPVIVIGHNDAIAWGVTNLQADAVDYFVETPNPDDSTQYRHRGGWKKLVRTTETIPVKGADPKVLEIDSTVHGPVLHREGRMISLCWTGLVPTRDHLALWRIGRAQNLQDYLQALEDLSVPAMNLVYGDTAGNIAIHPTGDLPLRTRGQGRIPLDGASGEFDWRGMIPRREMPLAVNPVSHYVASANGRPQPLGFPHYLGWMWDPSYRTRRIHELLAAADGVTLEKMQAIQNDAYDLAARQFLPTMLAALGPDDTADAVSAAAAHAARNWDYVAQGPTAGPAVWLRWFEKYRDAVWKDEWVARGIQQPGGSWGFSGDNRREPMLEVLEFITREQPESHWFDDQATPERETRDEIIRRAWREAIPSLRQQLGDDLARWNWDQVNTLRLRSLASVEQLDRNGGPVAGDIFTLNPGSNVGTVGGGASWRMIVDFGAPKESLGVYPGGQSDDPASPWYDDQMRLWAKGEYVPLMMQPADKLPAQWRGQRTTFQPAPP